MFNIKLFDIQELVVIPGRVVVFEFFSCSLFQFFSLCPPTAMSTNSSFFFVGGVSISLYIYNLYIYMCSFYIQFMTSHPLLSTPCITCSEVWPLTPSCCYYRFHILKSFNIVDIINMSNLDTNFCHALNHCYCVQVLHVGCTLSHRPAGTCKSFQKPRNRNWLMPMRWPRRMLPVSCSLIK